jgi:glycine cleavage system aminomethyltransferase T
MLFPLGRIVATPGALQALETAGQQPAAFLDRHVSGDWGELDDEDKRENEFSVRNGFRILSAYITNAGDKLWIITEADRSATTFLLPQEY